MVPPHPSRGRPEPPELSISLARGLLTRRTVLMGAGSAAAAAVLAACGTPGTAGTPDASRQSSARDLSDVEKVVRWSNWPEYIDVDDETQTHPTLDQFTEQTGIRVEYTEDYNDNDEFFAKMRPALSTGRDTGRDLWCSTDWLVARLIRLGWVQKLNKANIPNADNLEPSLRDVEFDPGRLYSMPWQSGFTGIAYNESATGGRTVTSMDQLLTDPALKGRVTLLTEMRDTVGMVLLALGKDPATFTDADFQQAIDELTRARDAGQLRGFTGNDYGKPLASGDIAAALAWTGDVVQLQADNPALGYTLPQTGHMLWSDNFIIPQAARHKKNAEKLINYYYNPQVMAHVEAYVNYIAPVVGAREALLKEDPSVAENPLIFPDATVMARAHVFRGLSQQEETAYNRAFQALIGG